MKFNHSDSHSDSGGSFLDIVFCLCVVLCLALVAKSHLTTQRMAENQKKELEIRVKEEAIKIVEAKEAIEVEEIIEVVEAKEVIKIIEAEETIEVEEIIEAEVVAEVREEVVEAIEVEEIIEVVEAKEFVEIIEEMGVEEQFNGKVQFNRFSGRGGQPKLKIKLHYGESGLVVLIGDLEFSYKDFRKIICNIDRKESDGSPSFLFSTVFSNGYVEATVDMVYDSLDKKIDKDTIRKAKNADKDWWIVNLYRMRYNDLEKKCRKFKLKNTSLCLGNWDLDSIAPKEYSSYESRKKKGKPFIWFTVDNEEKNVIMGPKEDPVFVSPTDFITLISNIEGYDGFYLEYRDRDSLRYEKNLKVPDWVLKEIINPLGYGANLKK